VERCPIESFIATSVGQDAPSKKSASSSAHKVRQLCYYCMTNHVSTATKQEGSHTGENMKYGSLS